ncbi:MAG: hypothetical protein ABI241_00675 [Bacteroidia bacterium]
MEKRHHYRAIAKSDHLGVADLEDFIEAKTPLFFTIKHVKQELDVTVAGKKGNFNIAYFVEKIKPLVLNNTNAKVVKNFCNGSPFVEDWVNVPIELFIDEMVKMKGETVGGVRIKNIKPSLPILALDTKAFTNAVDHIRKGGKIEDIEKRYVITPQIKLKIEEDANIK